MQLGEMLVSEKIITEIQLNEALAKQKTVPSKMIGEILLELGYIDVETFTKVLDRQLKEGGLCK